MNRTYNQFVILFLSLFLFGCNGSSDKTVSVRTKSKQAILMDSLQKLDSLVLKYRAKNATESMGYARQAGKLAEVSKTPEARAKAYIILGNAISVIRVDSGFFFFHKALIVIDSFNLTDDKGTVLYNLGLLNDKAGNYKECIRLVDSALRFSISVKDFKTKSNSLNSLGSFYYDIGEKEIARKMFDSAFTVAKSKSLYLQMGSALGNLARFEPDEKKSIAESRLAISYLERSSCSDDIIAMILINIGYRFSDIDSAFHYYNQAINRVSVDYAPEVMIAAYNNLAYCYLEKGDLEKAKMCIEEYALPVAVKTNNTDWLSTVYDTYADVLQKKGNADDARVYKRKSMEVKKTFRASVSANLLSKKNN